MADITLEQKKLLEPFGQIFANLDNRIREMSDEELQQTLEACYATSVTNCWCCTFDAAQHLQRDIRREQSHRARMRMNAAATA